MILLLYHRDSVYSVQVTSASVFPLLHGIICLRGHAVFKPSAVVRDTQIFQGQKMGALIQVMP